MVTGMLPVPALCEAMPDSDVVPLVKLPVASESNTETPVGVPV